MQVSALRRGGLMAVDANGGLVYNGRAQADPVRWVWALAHLLANGDLALSMVRWLVREERTTSVSSRIPVPPMILLSGAQMRTIFLAVAVLLPLAAFVPGLLAWWRRR